MIKRWTDDAWADYVWWQGQDRKTLKRINALIRDIERDPFSGLGKPEPLRYDLSGTWSSASTRPTASCTPWPATSLRFTRRRTTTRAAMAGPSPVRGLPPICPLWPRAAARSHPKNPRRAPAAYAHGRMRPLGDVL